MGLADQLDADDDFEEMKQLTRKLERLVARQGQNREQSQVLAKIDLVRVLITEIIKDRIRALSKPKQVN